MSTVSRLAARRVLQALAVACAVAPASASQQIQWERCELPGPRARSYCAAVPVPENYDAPAARSLPLQAITYRPLTQGIEAEPVFVLHDTPGLTRPSVLRSSAGLATALASTHQIVFVTPRGTSTAEALACPDAAGTPMSLASPAALLRACRAALASRADLARYRSTDDARDLDRVRDALGAGRVTLYGTGYGARVALEYMRLYPARVHTAVLAAPAPAGAASGAGVAP
ncbi:MAG: alpha/beta hydrolase, partial [Acidobacteriota bacterium]|nr:alpha/beta hydrolase [Acidobacteriota bacterium]